MGSLLEFLYNSCEIRISSIYGGSKDNAIPRECVANVSAERGSLLPHACIIKENEIKERLCAEDGDFSITVEPCEDNEALVFGGVDTRKIIFLLSTVGDGVFSMCEGLDSVVEFSRNLGIVEVDASKGDASFVFMTRSAKDEQIESSSLELEAFAKSLGMEHKIVSSYSGWDRSPESPLCKLYAESYKALYGEECSVNVIHAGLECGIIKKLCPKLDIISCGPMILDLHSPDEALNIASFERFFTVVLSMLTK
jgi:dipeptidase D